MFIRSCNLVASCRHMYWATIRTCDVPDMIVCELRGDSVSRRVAVIGLDCAEPSLVFDRWLDQLPVIKSLVERGTWGTLRSTDPPITVPAWSCMMTSRDPGQLGVYGFRNRKDFGYQSLSVARSDAITTPRLWDLLGAAGKHVITVGVPQTSPPVPVSGELVSCFLTADPREDPFTYPPELRREIEELVGPYHVDVRNFRSDDRDRILAEIYEMTEQHFTVARHLLDTRPWDFFMMVEIGVDRIHHAFWRYLDESHPDFVENHRYRNVILDYYRYLDDEIGDLLTRFDNDTDVFVVSDHGARAMQGSICINEWLQREGYLTLVEPPSEQVPLHQAKVDWSRTRAWGEGGYYCRLCLNVSGREPHGVVRDSDYDALRDELITRLEEMAGPDGKPLGNRVYRPEDLWVEQNGIPPDLLVYFGDLGWRSNGSIGSGQIFSFENDTGPDDANHARYGMLIGAGPRMRRSHREDRDIYDLAPTIMELFGLEIPETMRGKSFASPDDQGVVIR